MTSLSRLGRRFLESAPPRLVLATATLAGRRPPTGASYDVFVREGRPPVRLIDGYRDSCRQVWRRYWWPLAALYRLREADLLTPDLDAMLAELDAARTLPFPVAEAVRALAAAASELGDALVHTGGFDEELGVPVLAVPPSDAEIRRQTISYAAYADAIAGAAARGGVRLEGSRLLDVGFGSGALAFAVAGAGAAEVVGVDLEPDHYSALPGRARLREALCRGREDAVRLLAGDAQQLEFEDASFDIVYSATALEHVRDVRTVLRETARVLRPGGIAHHGVDPWFGPRGGHSLCTLDFPWGHVRTSVDELGQYVAQRRPHEAADALAYRSEAFQLPALTMREFRGAAVEAGFEILEFDAPPLGIADPHRRYLDRDVLADCRRLHLTVTPRDLLTLGFTTVLRRPRRPAR